MTTTTCEFQIKPDYYKSKEERDENIYKKVNTNPRYKNFNQTHFTAGDEEQFEKFMFPKSSKNKQKISLKDNLWNDMDVEVNERFENLSPKDTINTFNYIFHKFKKGIFVKIQNNELKVFLPFSKNGFINEWSSNIDIDKTKFFNELQKINTGEGRKFNIKYFNRFANSWYGNNCLIRYEYPVNETDTNNAVFKNFLEELCKNRKIPDIEFFLNRRDFPILKKDNTEPYNHIWNSSKLPLVSHSYEKYIPILSMCNSSSYHDFLIPTWEDWIRLKFFENKWFNETNPIYKKEYNKYSWEEKIPTAVFRGATTGPGVDIHTNNRLKISYLSSKNVLDEDGIPLLDAGITKWKLRHRKLQGEKELKFIDKDKLLFDLVPRLDYEEQSKYKYIINIDGHVAAFRLSTELNMNSVILLVDSEWKIWYRHLLKPYIHYVPVKKDLSNIYEQIKWCKQNDKKCKEIALNAKKFYDTYLNEKSILDYFQNTLCKLSSKSGKILYNEIDTIKLQEIIQFENISKNCKFFLNTFDEKLILETIFINKLSHIYSTTELIKDQKIIIKRNSNTEKQKETFNEIFLYSNVLEKYYINNIPKFYGYNYKPKTFEANVQNKVVDTIDIVIENIQGKDLQKYILEEKFSQYEMVSILLQVCLTIQILQDYCNFVHNDLTPWNIIIHKFNTYKNVVYNLQGKKISIKTNIVPYIIDFGKSHYIYNNSQYGVINPYSFSSIIDVILLVFKTSKILLQDRNDFEKSSFVKNVFKFFSKSKYSNYKFLNNLKEIQTLLHTKGKFVNIIKDDKFELENLKPKDFINFLIKEFKFSKNIISIENVICKEPKLILEKDLLNDVNKIIKLFSNSFHKKIDKYFIYTKNKNILLEFFEKIPPSNLEKILYFLNDVKKYKLNNIPIQNKFIIDNYNFLLWIISLHNTIRKTSQRMKIINFA